MTGARIRTYNRTYNASRFAPKFTLPNNFKQRMRALIRGDREAQLGTIESKREWQAFSNFYKRLIEENIMPREQKMCVGNSRAEHNLRVVVNYCAAAMKLYNQFKLDLRRFD